MVGLRALLVVAATRLGEALVAPRATMGPTRCLARACAATLGGSSSSVRRQEAEEERLPRAVLPVTLSVFAQMIGEGIAISTLPLHMTVGVSTSCFSVAQFLCCPLLVRRSKAMGRVAILRICLLGATVSNVGIACSSSVRAIVACRFAAGAFAASVPVAQAAVTDVVGDALVPLALSRVAAASQTAVVVGPSVAALLLTLLGHAGLPDALRLRVVFAATAVFALACLGLLAATEAPSAAVALRTIALVVGWSLTCSVYCYGLFAPRILGYGQRELSMTYSAGAATTIVAQLAFPRLVRAFGGAHVTQGLGLLGIALGLSAQSLVHAQPWHAALYLANRAGAGIADTSTATLVAQTSETDDDRAANLALIQSTRAAARVVTPLLTGSFLATSLSWPRPFTGVLPFFANAAAALALAPLPILLSTRRNTKNTPKPGVVSASS